MRTKMSLATTGIYCTISPPLSGAMEDCSIILVQQLQMLSPKALYVRVTTHVRLAVERSRRSRASVTRWQSSARYDDENATQRPMTEHRNVEVDALAYQGAHHH